LKRGPEYRRVSDPPEQIKQDEEVKTRTLILLAAFCAVAILAASAVQVLLAH
jgi:hypothetical protein